MECIYSYPAIKPATYRKRLLQFVFLIFVLSCSYIAAPQTQFRSTQWVVMVLQD